MSEYLDSFPAPFLEDLVAGRCIPFVGAGLSLNADLPAGKEMRDWDGVGRFVAESLPDYQYTTALEALSSYDYQFHRAKLVELLNGALHIGDLRPGNVHEAFCGIPFDRVVTTNWDHLLEAAYLQSGRYCMPLLSEDQLGVSKPEASVKLLKLHGDLHHPDRMVVTEEDYDGFLTRFPLIATYLSSLLIEHTAFFIGYSLDDPDFRQVWQVVKDRLGNVRRPAYVLQVGAPQPVIARYERRGVKVINLEKNGHSYGETLSTAFDELREYWSSNLPLISTSADSESQLELSLPSGTQTRLAFFAVPTRDASLYKEHLYPVAERHGFTPIMALDVEAPGENIMAKVQAMIRKSAVLFVDLTSQIPSSEALMAFAGGRQIHVIAISKTPADVRSVLAAEELGVPTFGHLDVHVAPRGVDVESMQLLMPSIDASFARASSSLSATLNVEPRRLLSKGEFRAAVVSAFSLLEYELRLLASGGDEFPVHRGSPGTRELLDHAAKQEVLPGDLAFRLQGHLRVRNKIAHSPQPIVDEAGANRIVHDVMSAVDTLRQTPQAEA